jgi:membrane protein
VHFGKHNCSVMAAGMSFFGMFSLIPLTLLGVSMLGYLLGPSEDAQQFVSKLLSENFPESAEEMLNQIDAIITSPKRGVVNGLSVLGLMWSGMRFFNILQRVLNNVWVGATQRRFLRGRAAAFGSFVVAGLLFWASFVFTSSMAAARELDITFRGVTVPGLGGLWLMLELITPAIASLIMLFLVYLLVPHARVSLRAALVGASFAALFLQLSRWVFSFVMVRFDVYGRVYGPLASFIMFMSWLYLSMAIVLLGAELGSQCQEMLFSADRGIVEQEMGNNHKNTKTQGHPRVRGEATKKT